MMTSNHVQIIAEIGVNHDGSVDKAKKLVESAISCGADVVKFQSFKASELAGINTPKAPYQKVNDQHTSHYHMLENLELSHHEQSELFTYCNKLGIEFLSTPYSIPEAKFLNSLGVKRFKIASADIVDLPLHEEIASYRKPTIISTGMASLFEVNQVIEIYKGFGTELTLMHCTSEYPTPAQHSFMRRIETIKKLSAGNFGFSDHTIGMTAAVMAVAMGSKVIEKHFTLDKGAVGPDNAASMDEGEFRLYSSTIREAEISMGDGTFFQTEAEKLFAMTSRKSIHLFEKVAKGDEIILSNLILMRPGNGISWSDKQKVVGSKAKIDLPALHLLCQEDVH